MRQTASSYLFARLYPRALAGYQAFHNIERSICCAELFPRYHNEGFISDGVIL